MESELRERKWVSHCLESGSSFTFTSLPCLSLLPAYMRSQVRAVTESRSASAIGVRLCAWERRNKSTGGSRDCVSSEILFSLVREKDESENKWLPGGREEVQGSLTVLGLTHGTLWSDLSLSLSLSLIPAVFYFLLLLLTCMCVCVCVLQCLLLACFPPAVKSFFPQFRFWLTHTHTQSCCISSFNFWFSFLRW